MELASIKHTNKTKLRKGDEVMIMNGRSKGHKAKIEKIDLKNYRVYVAGANLYKKHQRPDQNNPDGGIVDKPMSLHLSNVMLVDPKSHKPTRIGYKVDENGKKERITKSSKTPL